MQEMEIIFAAVIQHYWKVNEAFCLKKKLPKQSFNSTKLTSLTYVNEK